MDFTLKIYKVLINSALNAGYKFYTFEQYIESKKKKLIKSNDKIIILRHDVDLLPRNSLKFAQIQKSFGVSGSYYFRAVPESWDEKVIIEISKMGHEIGYHYENLDYVARNIMGNSHDRRWYIFSQTPAKLRQNDYRLLLEKSYINFQANLNRLRELCEVKTICMHGSPRSFYDNRELWSLYNYKNDGIIGEPYFDIDFNDFYYLTDTGRSWNGLNYSVRDKVEQQYKWQESGLIFKSTREIIKSFESGSAPNNSDMPQKIMFTMHPQRWNKFGFVWFQELILQNLKNLIKKSLAN